MNRCQYCTSAHTAIGKHVGIPEDEILNALHGKSNDEKINAALKFVSAIYNKHGQVSDDELAAVKAAGYTDGDIAEIVSHVALNVFTNYFNNVAQTEIDFPKVELF